MRWRIVFAGLVLAVVLAFGAGAFALYVFPGRAAQTDSTQVAVVPTPYIPPCDRLREDMLRGVGQVPFGGKGDFPITFVLQILECGPAPQGQ